jgi:hypothetical protein
LQKIHIIFRVKIKNKTISVLSTFPLEITTIKCISKPGFHCAIRRMKEIWGLGIFIPLTLQCLASKFGGLKMKQTPFVHGVLWAKYYPRW